MHGDGLRRRPAAPPATAPQAGSRWSDAGHDLSAALVLVTLLIPTGMGYAELAGLPAVTGLYATIAALLAYAVCGTSRTLIMGPDSSLAPVVAVAVVPLADGDPDRAVALAGLLAIMTGGVLLAGSMLHLAVVMDLLSKPIRLGYLNGIAFTVVVSQVPKMLGFSTSGDSVTERLVRLVDGVRDGRVVLSAAAVGLATLAAIAVLRRAAPRVPALLVAVAGATAAVVWLGLDDVPVVGSLPSGFPSFALGVVSWRDVTVLLPAALGIALIAFADTGVLAHALAALDDEKPCDTREMAALGVTNLAAGAFGGFPVSGSASRTPVARQSGARTRLTGAFAAGLVAVVLVAFPGATAQLPSAALAAAVLVAVYSLADVRAVARLRTARSREFGLALMTFAGVVGVGVLWGIGVAVALALLDFVAHAWRPHMAELGRIDGRKGYHDLERHPDGRRIPGLVIIRFDAPLFFANSTAFSGFVEQAVEAAAEPVRWVVVAAEPITDIDTTAADMLVALDDWLSRRGIRLVFAELKGPVKDRLATYGLAVRFGPQRFHSTVGRAVSSYVSATGVPWVDWTDRRREGMTARQGRKSRDA